MLDRIKYLLVRHKAKPNRRRSSVCPLDSVNSGLMCFEERIVPASGNAGDPYTWSPIGTSRSWTDQNNWLDGNWPVASESRGHGYPGSGAFGYQDQALLGAYKGDCHVDGAITIATLQLTGFADTLYVDNPLYVEGYPTNGVWGAGNFQFNGGGIIDLNSGSSTQSLAALTLQDVQTSTTTGW